jgi:hypothetical protein
MKDYPETFDIMLEAVMATIQPKDEKVKEAIKWISTERSESKNTDVIRLINNATMRFDLSPKEEEFLISFYRNKS